MDRFGKSLLYIEQRLMEPLTLPQVAAASHYSAYHYARMFKAVVGLSVMDYVRRRRLTFAANLLRGPEPPQRILDLALACGFDSQEAFTRAFKRQFGVPPRAYRTGGDPGTRGLCLALDIKSVCDPQEIKSMQPKFLDREAFTVVGLSRRFTGEDKTEIPQLWADFSARLDDVQNCRGEATYGVCQPVEGETGEIDYMAGIEVSVTGPLPPGMTAVTVPRGHYAVFTHRFTGADLHGEIGKVIQYIWGTWLGSSGYAYTGAPDFEYYDSRFSADSLSGEIDFYIPVIKEQT